MSVERKQVRFDQNALLYIVHGFRPENENFGFGQEQNGTNFSFIAPSSEEL